MERKAYGCAHPYVPQKHAKTAVTKNPTIAVKPKEPVRVFDAERAGFEPASRCRETP